MGDNASVASDQPEDEIATMSRAVCSYRNFATKVIAEGRERAWEDAIMRRERETHHSVRQLQQLVQEESQLRAKDLATRAATLANLKAQLAAARADRRRAHAARVAEGQVALEAAVR